MRIATKHFVKDKLTIAIQVPTRDNIIELIEGAYSNALLNLGTAFTHSKEQYEYKLGRKVASGRIKSHDFFFDGLEMREKSRCVVSFVTFIEHPHPNRDAYRIRVGFSFIRGNPRVRLEYAEITNGNKRE